jgi:cytochrome c1
VLEGKVNLRHQVAQVVVSACCLLTACNGGKELRPYTVATGGNPANGKQIIQGYGCGACHMIPGIPDARGLVGPPLLYFGQRTMIAGELPNTPDNLLRWLKDPQSVEPKTAMPNLGLTDGQASDVAAYLYTLRGPEGRSWSD